MDYSWAKPGVKVVCIDASQTDKFGLEHVIFEGSVYEIEWVGELEGQVCVRLVGVSRDLSVSTGPVDHPFRLSRFRPFTTKTIEDDMELFAPLLKVELVGAPV